MSLIVDAEKALLTGEIPTEINQPAAEIISL